MPHSAQGAHTMSSPHTLGRVLAAGLGMGEVAGAGGVLSPAADKGAGGVAGDGGAATSASLSRPASVALDAGGNLYIADLGNERIRKVAAATGIITTVAGNGVFGFAGDGGAATNASLGVPVGVAVDAGG